MKKTVKNTVKKDITKKTPSPSPRKKRVPMNSTQGGDTTPIEARDKNFHYRKCADYGKGKIQQYLDAGYEYVCHEGTNDKIVYPGGHKRWLMRIPMDLYLEDQLAKQQKVIDTNAKARAEHASIKGGAVPDYIPGKQSNVITTDGLS
ncbi:MAG: hypothetical protein E2O80_00395 [Betaproteobacteria bacterium]|jgi:hypothetical protein|nr:MAG: hypothetical protein E2O80_00395 [Betaproteobacteria bacterium]